MPLPWFAQLKSFIRRVLGLPMPSLFDDVFDARVSNSPLGVNPALMLYIKARASRISNPDGTLSDPPSPRIRTVRLKKCLPTLAEHEFILVEVVSGNRPLANDVVIGQLKVERAYDPINGNAFLAALVDSSCASTTSSTSGTFPLPSKFRKAPIPARDTITFDPKNTHADTTVFSYTFDEASAPSLLDLLVAADTLNIHSPHYILFQRQCYWFGGMLLRILLGNIDTDPLVQPGLAEDTLFSPAFDPSETDPKPDEPPEPIRAGLAGTFKKLFKIVTNQSIDSLYNGEIKQVYQSRQGEVAELLKKPELIARQVAAIREALEARARKAEEALEEASQEVARKTQEAARQAEEATRAHEEATRAREEATRAREEAARQAEEATRAREEAARACEEMARMREEIARLKVTGTERHGPPPHAQ
ncbi:hypothetical protein TRAPUB_1137 [Trametes pubescens]|uniref:Uncharacterized protein n=1 Tax=Trametes pubescens TaxID=154538 RepID=A0A1M2VK36_TRAPU|nr:hypothetical protein TRAPUB_1137 [Trametes pubescens]